MKLIKISTDLEMTIHEFPEGRRGTGDVARGAE